MHAIDADMMEYVFNSADKANAFILARAGYDVWLGNNRGSKYSIWHRTLNHKTDKQYWDYYQEEMGTQDVPSFIEKILYEKGLEEKALREENNPTTAGSSTSNQNKFNIVLNEKHTQHVSYIGHSEGTTQFLLGASLKPDYFKKRVNFAVLMAPVAVPHHVCGPLNYFAHHIDEFVEDIVYPNHMWNLISPHVSAGVGTMDVVCKIPMLKPLCKQFWDAVTDPTLANPDRVDMASHVPSGQTWRALVYYAQLIVSGNYTRYDYGSPEKNEAVYGPGVTHPPYVPLKENYQVPTAVFYGDVDPLSVTEDVVELINNRTRGLKHTDHGDMVVYSRMIHAGHGTFVTGNDMSFFSKDVVELLGRFNPGVIMPTARQQTEEQQAQEPQHQEVLYI